ncbi:MAG TPA: hypothetical protein RMH99_15930 [Sandaracinaceae bacterium LLY-WYZ-13_1]|nr:hypothetical protein [Sandaracinaceae bacterium LLY-WYZ-13_1]
MSGAGRRRRRQGLAAIVTVAGVLAIWTWSTVRQQSQTEELSRRWLGEQWDVARHCLVGTPIGRSEGPEAVERLLVARLLETLAEASEREADAPLDPDTLWPARCVPRLADVRADPSVLRADPGDARATLEVLAPRVIRVGPDGPAQLALGESARRARELAEPIATLDRAMPPGAEYDPARYADAAPRVPPLDVVRSVSCGAPAPRRRPFLDARLGDRLLLDEVEMDDRSMRLTTSPEAATVALAVASPEGTETTELERRGSHARIWDATHLLWLDGDRVRRTDLAGEEVASVSVGAPAVTFALCRRGEVAHLIVSGDEGMRWVRWPAGGRDATPVPIPGSVSGPAVVTCSEDALALAAHADGRWEGVRCVEGACEELPPLAAGGDLQLALRGAELLAVARGRRTDLSLARRLGDSAWREPTVVMRGALEGAGSRFVLRACEGAIVHRSTDGRAWTGVPTDTPSE